MGAEVELHNPHECDCGEFDNKLILVTGASSGIGLASAKLLAARGAKIIGMARSEAELSSAISSLPGEGHECIAADAGIRSSYDAVIKLAKGRGGLSGVVAAAGMHKTIPLAMLNEDKLEEVFRANVTTAIHAIRAAAASGVKTGLGVVLLSSIAALRGTPGFMAYSASKGALISAAKTAAVELAGRQIRVNVLLPGVVKTQLSDGWMSRLSSEAQHEINCAHLLGEGTPTDIAEAIAFFVSDKSRWITGATLAVDGGFSAH